MYTDIILVAMTVLSLNTQPTFDMQVEPIERYSGYSRCVRRCDKYFKQWGDRQYCYRACAANHCMWINRKRRCR